MSELSAERLRARAERALARVKRLGQPSTEELDGAVAELADIERLMSSSQPSGTRDYKPVQEETLLWRVRVALGSVSARRWLLGGRAQAEKVEAIRLLRTARGAGRLNAENDSAAMVLLALLLLPGDAASVQSGTIAGLQAPHGIGLLLAGGGQAIADLHEARGLLVEVRAARPDDPQAAGLAAYTDFMGSVSDLLHPAGDGGDTPATGWADLLAPLTADSPNPLASVIRALMPLLPAASPAPADAEPQNPAESIPDDLLVEIAVLAPGAIGEDELPGVIERLEQAPRPGEPDLCVAALGRCARAVRTNDPGELRDAVQALQTALRNPAVRADHRWLGHTVFPAMLVAASMTHGNLEDAAKAAGLLQQPWSPPPGVPGAEGLRAGRAILGYRGRTDDAWAADDDEGLESLVRELEEAERTADPSGELYFLMPFQLAVTELCLATRRPDAGRFREALRHLEKALDASTGAPEAVRPLMESVRPMMLALSAQLEHRPVDLTEPIARARSSLASAPFSHDQRVQGLLDLALARKIRCASLDGAARKAALDEVIDELRQARAALTEHSSSATATMVHWELAQAHRERDDADLADAGHAVTGALESLRLLADDVLLQSGPEDGLRTARTAADRGLRAAGWALSIGHLDAAVECLELGRALVLGTAAAAGTIPDRLRTAGAAELAQEWERAPSAGSAQDLLTVPSDLRRRALNALRRAEAPGPLASPAPSSALIAGELGRSGLDALVYLLPETADSAGRALVTRADGGTCDLPLPGLRAAAREPFDRYLESSAHRYSRLRGPARSRDLEPFTGWESALDQLCDWAGRAVLDPLLDALPAEPTPDRPARVVFVPCGLLGLVPWQAARLHRASPAGGPARPLRACDLLVLSYAASATQLLRSLARPRRPYRSDPVFVVDPTGSLGNAGPEAVAIRDAYLPAARFMGFVEGEATEAPGTPEEVLAQAVGGPAAAPASMVQISAHGTAGTGPTASRLLLAAPAAPIREGAADAGAGPGQPRSARPGPGHLTVARILASAWSGEAARAASLIVLDSCETDLTSRFHDEALTLTTAFVARGAGDVIGSRWAIDDWSSAVCIVVFHHYLAAGCLAPADALRAAQRWMLGPAPAREPIAAVERLLERDGRPLDAVSAWAPFIHQGNARPW